MSDDPTRMPPDLRRDVYLHAVGPVLASRMDARGIRDWWRRPRKILDGQSAAAFCSGSFDPDSPMAMALWESVKSRG